MLNQDIIREATRLTRAGQLVEATALLQRMLRGEKERGAAAPRTGHPSLAPGREPPTIDAKAKAAETRRPRRTARPPADLANSIHGLGLGRSLGRAPPSTADIVPDGARFIEGVYANAAGSRTYRLFIPSGYHGQAIPLVVMLHGCTQSPEDFAAGTRMNFIAEEQTCFVAYPAQRAEANQAKCWNWFRPADQQRGRGEPSLIAGITRQIMRDHSVDPERVYVAGLSAGAAAAAVMGSTYGDLYAAIGIHSGLACGAASDLPSALMAMKQGGGLEEAPSDGPPVPTIVFHGDRDTTVHSKNGVRIVRQSIGGSRTKAKVHRGRVPGGHAYTRTVHTDAGGRGILEHWEIHGAGHAWSGGSPAGSYTDPDGPDATREMLRFFLEHSLQRRRNY
ncbi:PHB depolymerase family esterase [Bradyrhizobium sp. C-145]|uniref:extracellular catalytic domain type 1 short-chain-length polyhydroxyalkanoate depolymerase n=1 Tax=Bradyrhizobium sp. C-145 TaxID=574727 RepID=UPI00201B64EB|nr:PHB depolymerase family esterase [Bradyrhizobium sp. C-145]UQR60313.1 PHB depolymerase family esterase [Bradyrhizobium sp. C-145]